MSPLTRRALSLMGSAALVVTLVGCSDDSSDTETDPTPTASEESDEPSEDADDAETDEPTEDVQTISASDLEEQVASFMDGETGTTFPVECDGDLDAVVDEEQRCWRIIDGLEDEGVPDGSRLGITVTITELTDDGPSFYVQADDTVSPPED